MAMRSLAELQELRQLHLTEMAWSTLNSLHAEASHVGSPMTRSIFQIGYASDIPAARIMPILGELADAGAIEIEVQPDPRMIAVSVL